MNHKDIVKALRAAGWRVFNTSALGHGFPDMVVVLKNGRACLLFEVKPETGGQVTADEVRYMMALVEPTYRVVDTFEQAQTILEQEDRR